MRAQINVFKNVYLGSVPSLKRHCNAQLALKLTSFTLYECGAGLLDSDHGRARDPDKSVSTETNGHLLTVAISLKEVESLAFLRQYQGGFGFS